MITEVTIPNLGYTMTVGKILKWVKSVGDPVETNDVLVEIETDKVVYGVESLGSGILKLILAKEGDEIPVGGIIGIVAAAEEEVDPVLYQDAGKEKAAPEAPQEVSRETVSTVVAPAAGAVLASPIAKRLAREKGVDLSLVKGTGRSGRIELADVENYVAQGKPGKAKEAAGRASSATGLRGEGAEVVPMSTMRKTIGQRLCQSSREAPHFYLMTEVDMKEVRELLSSYNSRTEKDEIKVSINDVLIKAVAILLHEYPYLNARLRGDQIEIPKSINIGLAVALDEGLIVPSLESASAKKLRKIATERKKLVERARQGQLTWDEIQRGTFTISNLGMYDIVLFTSIINPPQSSILSVGRIMERPVVRDGAVVIRPILNMTLAIDHRVVDGAMGARFLSDLKKVLENPYFVAEEIAASGS